MSATVSLTSPPAVTLWRERQFLYVSPPNIDLLQPVLQTSALSCRPDTLRVGRRREMLFEEETYGGEPVLRCWAGLTPVVRAALRLAGVSVRFKGGLVQAPLPPPAQETSSRPSVDRPVLEFVQQHDRGLVRYDADQVSPCCLIAQLAKAWPDLHFTVAVTRKEDAYQLADELRTFGLNVVALTSSHHPLVDNQVAVSTYLAMPSNVTEPEWQDVVIALDAAEATAKNARWCLEHVDRARLYGFLDVRRRLSFYDCDLVRSLFGFEELVIPRHGYRVRPVEVVWARGDGRAISAPKNELGLKRYGLWRNDARNRQVSRLARALVAGLREEVVRLLPSLPTDYVLPSPGRVFVLVENVEHASALVNKLPDWPVAFGGLAHLEGMAAEQVTKLRERRLDHNDEKVTPNNVIVTEAGLRNGNLHPASCAVLLRADAGLGLPALPTDFLTVSGHERVAPFLVVDVDDRHHPALEQRSQRRRRAYGQAQWFSPVCKATNARVAAFLKARGRWARLRKVITSLSKGARR
jgi:hypothetical protein